MEYKIYDKKDNYTLYQGKMQDVLKDIEPNSVDSIICDPPYELNFMGKGWDNSGVAFNKDTWKHCFDVLKEGGYLLAFGGSRTFHRIACAIEDAGFEIRDTIMWLYGSGFPKSMNIGLAIDKKNGVESEVIGEKNRHDFSKHKGSMMSFVNTDNQETSNNNIQIKKAANEWDDWGTCLKPAFEPIIVARKPFKESLVDNIIKNGVGGLNIKECRVSNTELDTYDLEKRKESKEGLIHNDGRFLDSLHKTECKHGVTDLGRFPANVILTYDETDKEEVCGGMPITKSTKTNSPLLDIKGNNYNNSNKTLGITYERGFNDSGSAARYFYCAKASKKDRDEGLNDDFEEIKNKITNQYNMPRDNGTIREIPTKKNIHPTVKPTSLMQYLVRLVSPKGATILDCFMGSGSTGKAVMFENTERNANYKFIGVEMTEEYLPIAKARIEFAKNYSEDKEMTIFDYMGE